MGRTLNEKINYKNCIISYFHFLMKIVIIFVNFVKNVSLADESWYYTYQFETNLYKKLYVVFLCDFLNLCN